MSDVRKSFGNSWAACCIILSDIWFEGTEALSWGMIRNSQDENLLTSMGQHPRFLEWGTGPSEDLVRYSAWHKLFDPTPSHASHLYPRYPSAYPGVKMASSCHANIPLVKIVKSPCKSRRDRTVNNRPLTLLNHNSFILMLEITNMSATTVIKPRSLPEWNLEGLSWCSNQEVADTMLESCSSVFLFGLYHQGTGINPSLP